MRAVTGKLHNDQVRYLEEVVENGEADSISEAMRQEIPGGEVRETWLQWFVSELSKVLVFLTVGWMGATFFFPVEFRAVTLYLFGVTLLVVAGGKALAGMEPRISNWMTATIGRKTEDKA